MPPELSPEWLRLRRSIDIADGFAPYFVFSDWPEQIEAGYDYLQASLKLRTLRLRRLAVADPALLVEAAVGALLGAQAAAGVPLWLECWRQATDGDWQGARRQLLARLNEGRGRLEKDFRAPLILLLPRDAVATTAEAAPDLWSIRRLTLHFSRPRVVAAASGMPIAEAPTPDASATAMERAERRLQAWQRQTERQDAASLSLPDAWSSVEALREVGRLADAARVAREAVAAARIRRLEHIPETLRDLSVSLDNVGGVAGDLQDLEAARQAYEESLALSRQLRTALGDTPRCLEDLANVLAQSAMLMTRLERATDAVAALDEARSVAQRLAQQSPEHPRYRKLLQRIESHLSRSA